MLRCLARIPIALSWSRPCSVAATSSRWDGTMTIHTLPVITVPRITPTWMNAPRPERTCVSPNATANSAPSDNVAATAGTLRSGERQMPSYTIHAPRTDPSPMPIAACGCSALMDGSTSSEAPPM